MAAAQSKFRAAALIICNQKIFRLQFDESVSELPDILDRVFISTRLIPEGVKMNANNGSANSGSQKWAKVAVFTGVLAALTSVVTNIDTISKVVERWSSKAPITRDPSSNLNPIVLVISQDLLNAAAMQQSAAAKISTAIARPELLEAEAALRDVAAGLESPIEIRGNPPKWFLVAKGELGQKEIPGDENNPRILEYLADTNFEGEKNDEVPWASAFANWAFGKAGMQGTGSTNPYKWLKWGVQLKEPRLGALVLLARLNGMPSVCFFVSQTEDSILCLGGNFANAVSISALPKDRLIGYRWPKLQN